MTELDLIDCCRPLGATALADSEAEATAAVFKALADPGRVKIVNLLAQRDRAGPQGLACHRRDQPVGTDPERSARPRGVVEH